VVIATGARWRRDLFDGNRFAPVAADDTQVFTPDDIMDGRLPEGPRLPGHRRLAQRLGVSRNTLVDALTQLHAEGYVRPRGRSGTVISVPALPGPARVNAPALPLSAWAIRALRGQVPEAGGDTFAVDFRVGQPVPELYPESAWTQALARRAAQVTHAHPHDPLGPLETRRALAAYLSAERGARVTPDMVMLTGGTQSALDALARAGAFDALHARQRVDESPRGAEGEAAQAHPPHSEGRGQSANVGHAGVDAGDPGSCLVRGLAELDVPGDQPLQPQRLVHAHVPHLVEPVPDRTPARLVEQQVVALGHHQARIGFDRHGTRQRLLDRPVEARCHHDVVRPGADPAQQGGVPTGLRTSLSTAQVRVCARAQARVRGKCFSLSVRFAEHT
jgi:hypothetical protein